MNIDEPKSSRDEALERSGLEAGKAAGSWVLDGNSSREDARALLRSIDESELDIPSPLSGEWADGWDAGKVYFDAGIEPPAEDEPELEAEDLDRWEDSYFQGYRDEAERLARFYADIITAEIGTSGRFETIELTDEAADLLKAVELEHSPCSDSSCDIREAAEEGFPYVAAWLLQGATETPLLDAVIEHYGVRFEGRGRFDRGILDSDEFAAWREHVREFGTECPSCGSITFSNYGPAESCANCGAAIPRPREHEQTIDELRELEPREYQSTSPSSYESGRRLSGFELEGFENVRVSPTDGRHIYIGTESGLRTPFVHRGRTYELHFYAHLYRQPDPSQPWEFSNPADPDSRSYLNGVGGADELPKLGAEKLRAAVLEAGRSWVIEHAAELEAADRAALNNAARKREEKIAELAAELAQQLDELAEINEGADSAPRY